MPRARKGSTPLRPKRLESKELPPKVPPIRLPMDPAAEESGDVVDVITRPRLVGTI